MKRARVLLVGAFVALFTIFPGLGSPAHASHNCGIDEVATDDWGIVTTADYACDYYHHPKNVLEYIVCWLSPNC